MIISIIRAQKYEISFRANVIIIAYERNNIAFALLRMIETLRLRTK